MNEKFKWYFPATAEELDKIWNQGALTVDANVLLDLYRFHEDTRNAILDSLQTFKGKRWLSYQAATEFFRHRTSVIASAKNTFKEAIDEIQDLKKKLSGTTDRIKGIRSLPRHLSEQLRAEVETTLARAEEGIREVEKRHPDYLKNDEILKELLVLFAGAVGDDFPDSEKSDLEKQGNSRISKKIPPGYLDANKEGSRPLGDFYLWRQVLAHSKSANLPMILVTSDDKEDWWERISNRTIGPRQELLEEAWRLTGHRILIYKTDKFVEYAQQRSTKNSSQRPTDLNQALEEIREVIRTRSELSTVTFKEQFSKENTTTKNSGFIRIDLGRPTNHFTISGRLEPRMESAPGLIVRMRNHPESLPSVRLHANTGTTFDFNIHIASSDSQVLLPSGTYEFEYEAFCTPSTLDSSTLETL